MKRDIKSAAFICIVLSGLVAFACSDMNSLHDKYLKEGETIYIGQLDKALLYSGDGRAKLEYWSSDPKARKLKVYWNFRSDSLLLDIPENLGDGSAEVILDNLEEKKHTFEFISMDKDMKYRSIPAEGSVVVYGPKFKSTVMERNIRYAERLGENSLLISWQGAVENGFDSEVKYVDKDGVTQKLFVEMSDSRTQIDDFGEDLMYRTRILPDTLSIDTLGTEFVKLDRIDVELDRTLYARWNPPGIPYYQNANNLYRIESAFDLDPSTFYIQTAPQPGVPHSFTFDLGQEAVISRFRQWQRLTITVLYRIQNIKKFELWGSPTADVNADFDTWIKLGEFESKKPSGLPVGQESAEDIAYATAGEDFFFMQTPPKIRYIRYHVVELWGGNKVDIALGDITFFKDENEE